MRVTILGCGGSGGVPYADGTPGGNWGACDPNNPKNQRRRVSILVEDPAAEKKTTLLVDTSPDLRAQLIDAGVTALHAVFYTHEHADHCHGIDELRAFTFKRGEPLPAYMDETTRAQLAQRFSYALTSSCDPANPYKPLLDDKIIEGPMDIGGIPVSPFVQGHGNGVTTLGYRFGDLAYSTDVVSLDETAFAALAGVQVWIVDCLRDRPHPTHSHLAQTLEWIERVKPARAILTHMNHQIDYADLKSRCPAGVEPAYDGMVIEIEA